MSLPINTKLYEKDIVVGATKKLNAGTLILVLLSIDLWYYFL